MSTDFLDKKRGFSILAFRTDVLLRMNKNRKKKENVEKCIDNQNVKNNQKFH